jgi:hypothetical protein
MVIAIDTNKFRLERALDFGTTDAVEVGPGTVADVIALTDGLGVDVSIEAVGYPEALLTAASVVRPGGTITNIGVHGTVPVELAGHGPCWRAAPDGLGSPGRAGGSGRPSRSRATGVAAAGPGGACRSFSLAWPRVLGGQLSGG